MAAFTGEGVATPSLFWAVETGFGTTGGSRRVKILAVGRSRVTLIRCLGFLLERIDSRVNWKKVTKKNRAANPITAAPKSAIFISSLISIRILLS